MTLITLEVFPPASGTTFLFSAPIASMKWPFIPQKPLKRRRLPLEAQNCKKSAMAAWSRSEKWDSDTWQSKPNRRNSTHWKPDSWQSDKWWHCSQEQPINLPSHFVPSEECFDPTAVGGHRCFRTVQPSEWSRKVGLAGRPLEDIHAFEFAHKGIGDYALRLISKGRFQGSSGRVV